MSATAALEAAMVDMEAARAAFEATASRVGDELERLQERVDAGNTKASGERVHVSTEARNSPVLKNKCSARNQHHRC